MLFCSMVILKKIIFYYTLDGFLQVHVKVLYGKQMLFAMYNPMTWGLVSDRAVKCLLNANPRKKINYDTDIILDVCFSDLYYRGKKFVTYFFVEKPCSIMPKCWYIYCPWTLVDHLIFIPDFKMVTLNYLIFTQNSVISNENSEIWWNIVWQLI